MCVCVWAWYVFMCMCVDVVCVGVYVCVGVVCVYVCVGDVFMCMCVCVCMDQGGAVKLQKAQITLNDCLACSGCITSAESVLITQQSQDELYRILRLNTEAVQVSSTARLTVIISL